MKYELVCSEVGTRLNGSGDKISVYKLTKWALYDGELNATFLGQEEYTSLDPLVDCVGLDLGKKYILCFKEVTE